MRVGQVSCLEAFVQRIVGRIFNHQNEDWVSLSTVGSSHNISPDQMFEGLHYYTQAVKLPSLPFQMWLFDRHDFDLRLFEALTGAFQVTRSSHPAGDTGAPSHPCMQAPKP